MSSQDFSTNVQKTVPAEYIPPMSLHRRCEITGLSEGAASRYESGHRHFNQNCEWLNRYTATSEIESRVTIHESRCRLARAILSRRNGTSAFHSSDSGHCAPGPGK